MENKTTGDNKPKQSRTKKKAPKPYCKAIGVKNWSADFSGTKYEIIKEGEIDIITEDHFKQLSGRFIEAIQLVEVY